MLKLPVLGSLLFCGEGGQMLTNGGSMLPGRAENWPSLSNSSWRLYTIHQSHRLQLPFTFKCNSGTISTSSHSLCESRPLVTPYYCRLGDLLCFVFMSAYCMFDLSVYYLFLQYFDIVGWVFWPVKTVSHITYIYCVDEDVKHCSIQKSHSRPVFITILSLQPCQDWIIYQGLWH